MNDGCMGIADSCESRVSEIPRTSRAWVYRSVQYCHLKVFDEIISTTVRTLGED